MVWREGKSRMNAEGRKTPLVGSEIANLAAAAYLIKDGGFSTPGIKISRGAASDCGNCRRQLRNAAPGRAPIKPVKQIVSVLIAALGGATVYLLLATCGPAHATDGVRFAQRDKGAPVQRYSGTPVQRAACTPEVFRLCEEYIPNRAAIIDCLLRNKHRLSRDCRAVFDGSRSGR